MLGRDCPLDDGKAKFERVRQRRVDEEAGDDFADETLDAERTPLALGHAVVKSFGSGER